MISVPALSLEIHVKSTEKCSFITTPGFPVLKLTCSWQTRHHGFITLKELDGLNSLSPLLSRPALLLWASGPWAGLRSLGTCKAGDGLSHFPVIPALLSELFVRISLLGNISCKLGSGLGCGENAGPPGQNSPWYSRRQSDPRCGVWLTKSKQIKFKSKLLAGPGPFRKTMRKSHKL